MNSIKFDNKTKCFGVFVDDNYKDILRTASLEFYDDVKPDFDNNNVCGIMLYDHLPKKTKSEIDEYYIYTLKHRLNIGDPDVFEYIIYKLGEAIVKKSPKLLDPKHYTIKKEFDLQSGNKATYYFTNDKVLNCPVGLVKVKDTGAISLVLKIKDAVRLSQELGGPKHEKSYMKLLLAPLALLVTVGTIFSKINN